METQHRRRRDRELPPHDEIARRAYQLYELRGGQDGNDWDDWFQAEDELRLQARSRAKQVVSEGAFAGV